MKKMLLILVLVMLMPFVHAESELYASDPRIQELYEYSKAQADIVLSFVTDEEFEEIFFVENMDSFYEMFDKMIDATSIRACFMRKTGTDKYIDPEYPDLFSYNEFYEASPSSLCFNVISLANDNMSLPSISKIAEYSATYGYLTNIEDMPDVMYLMLMYGSDLPQIVTAFFEVDEDIYITKTSLVYSSGYELAGSINLAIPMVAYNAWDGIERFSWDIQ